ncbi:MAG: glutathione S-transferase family protein [Acinetobacter sp.]|jgi:glutathione S-transferase|uniref:Glutathione S-transferase family protein n=1 Tax=Acinetobacter guillouiae TaxID=106649 RepID=A0A8X8KCV0_ACIGI|nr:MULTISPECIES: glutathione S-transferase family protein [Acinetobacter]MBK5646904.1 glutathione S-transferase family protein [Acinetobacter sp.]KQW90528.1 glutathione S-transferase [Acinetobacter sp. Root1280]MCF0264774.1 glutathione S-transferase family protein [Acinetobacter guillouiae]MCU4493783.1 glutathione S-transferase family protein [Acinetobacter guillouiae]MDN5415929.1 glutathione S-transferase family protein [Acinetobacter sp.]
MGLKLYSNAQSRGLVIEWLLIELGAEFEKIELAYHTEMKSESYLKINPFGKVPTLVDGDVVIYEMPAICAYLADKFFDQGLAPALDDPKRGLYFRWLFFAAGPWDAATTDRALKVEITDEQKMHIGYGNFQDTYTALIQGLEQAQPYLCGEQFTVADVFVGSMLFWQLKMAEIESHPAIEKYLNSIKSRKNLRNNQVLFSD